MLRNTVAARVRIDSGGRIAQGGDAADCCSPGDIHRGVDQRFVSFTAGRNVFSIDVLGQGTSAACSPGKLGHCCDRFRGFRRDFRLRTAPKHGDVLSDCHVLSG
jgi:hypothetical protein